MTRVTRFFWLAQLVFAGMIWVGTRYAAAQATTASIVGSVTDATHAAVPDAEVKAQNESTGVTYTGQTRGEGQYVILSIPPGSYRVSVTKPGFETAVAKNVVLAIDQKQLINFELKVGEARTEITVTAAPTLLQTQSAETGEVVPHSQINNLPLQNRDFINLVLLVPGVVTGLGDRFNAFNFNINGQREFANSVLIDGIENTTNRTQDVQLDPSLESLQEFKVLTSSYSAEFGRSGGGVLSIETRSGTNRLHGTAFEFFRPNFLTARPFDFSGVPGPGPTLKQHIFGGSVGGPIFKNKTFFFVSYEGQRKHDGFNILLSVPPVDQIKVQPDGSLDLSGLVDPLTGNPIPIFKPSVSINCFGGCAEQFPGNIIPACPPDSFVDCASPAGLNAVLNFWPKPNLPGIDNGWFRNFHSHVPVTDSLENLDTRVDHNFSDKDRLSFSFHYRRDHGFSGDLWNNQSAVKGAGDADQAQNVTTPSQQYALSETHLFSNRILNEFRVGFAHFSQLQLNLLNGTDYSTKFGMGNVAVPGFPATIGYPQLFTTFFDFVGGSTFKPFINGDSNYQLSDKVSLSQFGKHQFKFGADFRRLNSHPNFSLFPTGFMFFFAPFFSETSDLTFTTFDPNAEFPNGGSDLTDMLLGVPFSVGQGLQLTDPHTRSWEMHFYGEDTYRMTPRLTLTYGIRYEFQAPYTEAKNGQSNYNPVTDSYDLAGRGSNPAGLINSRKNNFGPRLGLAYQVTPKTVVRAGYGFFYSPENDAREDILTKNNPFGILQNFVNFPFNGPCQVPAFCTGPYSYDMDVGVPRDTTIAIPAGESSIPASSIPNGKLRQTFFVTPNLKTGYTQSYNLAVERELGANFTLDVSYVGSLGHDLSYEVGDINRPDPVTGKHLSDNVGHIQALFNSGYAIYHSMQVKVKKRFSANLDFLMSYTWSHAEDNGPAPFDLGRVNNAPQDFRNLRAEFASSDVDIRHNLVFSGVYHLPIGRGQRFLGNANRPLDLILGGWQLNGIFTAHTGPPTNVTRNAFATGFEGLRPDLVGNPNIPKDKRTLEQYFNTDAFSVDRFSPPQCDPGANPGCDLAPGNAGRNLVQSPGFVSADLSLFKEFSFRESLKLQTRVEAFNITNTPHFCGADGNIADGPGSYGHILFLCGQNRIVQLGAKIIF